MRIDSFKLEDIPEWINILKFWRTLEGMRAIGDISFRDFMFLGMIIWSGRRIGEIINLTIDDINLEEGKNGIIYFRLLKKEVKKDQFCLYQLLNR